MINAVSSINQADQPTAPQVKYNRLGNSGLKVSKIILGAMGYGEPKLAPWMHDEETSLPLIEHAFNAGINTWDTADFYGIGKSEEILGKALKKYNIPRSKVVILTKCFFGVDQDVITPQGIDLLKATVNDGMMVNRVGLSRKHILDAVDASVARLGTYIDVLQIHRLDRDTPIEEIMRALNDVVESGKVRYIGASSMAAWEFQKLNNVAEKHGWHKFISMQNYHNLLYREEEREMFPYCKDAGIGLIPWSPLAGGYLARPWNNDDKSVREQSDQFKELTVRPGDYIVVNRLEEVAKKLNSTMAKVAIAWSISKGVNPILGLQSIKRIDEAVEGSQLELSEEDIKALDEVYQPKPVAPAW
ncbi:aldo-keto reductase [Polyplosphaeria fusca]|uniref:Aldo-keto reductase n=1 Tax=Polyplosphaeria fusca TaxID=682080 RepID=A0A9P4QUD8_9PLEO|nr:aldo-keto reductase [Polyplosphaeria fusca]